MNRVSNISISFYRGRAEHGAINEILEQHFISQYGPMSKQKTMTGDKTQISYLDNEASERKTF